MPLNETSSKNYDFSQFMLIGISGQVSFPRNKELFWGVVCVCMGRGENDISARFLFIQDGSERSETIRRCLGLKGACQLCRQLLSVAVHQTVQLASKSIFFFSSTVVISKGVLFRVVGLMEGVR